MGGTGACAAGAALLLACCTQRCVGNLGILSEPSSSVLHRLHHLGCCFIPRMFVKDLQCRWSYNFRTLHAPVVHLRLFMSCLAKLAPHPATCFIHPQSTMQVHHHCR